MVTPPAVISTCSGPPDVTGTATNAGATTSAMRFCRQRRYGHDRAPSAVRRERRHDESGRRRKLNRRPLAEGSA
jgi:hypothetical protein